MNQTCAEEPAVPAADPHSVPIAPAPRRAAARWRGPLDRAAPRPLSLRRNFCWAFAGNSVGAACQLGMLIALAKLGSTEMVGQFGLGLALTAPIMMLANLQLRVVQATDARREFAFGHYFGLRVVTTLVALLVIVGVTLGGGYRWATARVILAIGLSRAAEAVSDVLHGCLQQHHRMDCIARSQLLSGPLALGALSLVVFLTQDVFWGSLAVVGVGLIRVAAVDFPNVVWLLGSERASMRPRWDPRVLARLAWIALPLAAAATMISLETNMPRYFVERYFGEAELGIFVAIAYLAVAGRTAVQAITHSAVPRLAENFAAGNTAGFRRLLVKLVAICATIGGAAVLASIVAGREILAFLYRPEYTVHAPILVWLFVAAALRFLYEVMYNAVGAARLFRFQMAVQAVSLCLLAALCACVIESRGLYGVAQALLIVDGFSLALYTGLIAWMLRTKSGQAHILT